MNIILEKLFFRIQTLYFILLERRLSKQLEVPQRFYRFDLLKTMSCIKPIVSKCDILVDIGANKGAFARIFNEIYHPAKIYCVEPNSSLNGDIRNNLKKAELQVINSAVSNSEGEMEFHFHSDSQMSSLFESDKDLIIRDFGEDDPAKVVKKNVSVTTMDKIFGKESDLEGGSVFIKIDTQGNELDVINGGGLTLSKANFCLIEYMFQTPYKVKYHFEDIIKKMSDLEFRCVGPMYTSIRTTGEPGAVLFLFENQRKGSRNISQL